MIKYKEVFGKIPFISLLLIFLWGAGAFSASAQHAVNGVVCDSKTRQPLVGVAMKLDGGAVWTLSDENGKYAFNDIPSGNYVLEAEYLGYVSVSYELTFSAEGVFLKGNPTAQKSINFYLKEQSLALDEVMVTAQKSKAGLNTSVSIGRDALNHLQLSNITDISALLPGGKTINPDLTTDNVLSLRDGGSTVGNAAFGAALEVDGVRMGNNASLEDPAGISTRSISVDNIESVEVITGVPSAEYGDLNSGMVKVTTRKGRTPVHVAFSVNPRTYQVSASKGVELGQNGGVLNMSAEWARATSKLTSPYTSYTRRELGFTYSNTFLKNLRFTAGVSGNLGGMNSENDPDAFRGEYTKGNDNVIRANTSLDWLLRKSWITNLSLEASIYYNDKKTHTHKTLSYASDTPAPHSELGGYFVAPILPRNYFYDKVVDSRELDYNASLKYRWIKRWEDWKNELKAGVQWKASGNIGQGEYYLDPALAPAGYRPRPYSDYPYMHNLSYYLEDQLLIPMGKSKLELSAGLRLETIYVKNSQYQNVNSLSPRFNLKFHINEHLSVRGGWGVSEKMPSFFILYPKQEYTDIQTFSMSYTGNHGHYVYYTHPYALEYNPNLRWQRSTNSELAFEGDFNGFRFSLVGFYNIVSSPYRYSVSYQPISYNRYTLPSSFVVGDNPQIQVDPITGQVSVRNQSTDAWTYADLKMADRTFTKQTMRSNGSDITRAGAELTVDFPEIKPIRTTFRLDAAYTHTRYVDEMLTAIYPSLKIDGASYPYVGIYPLGASTSPSNGKITQQMDANLTAIIRIPEAKMVITARFEAALLRRSQNLSQYKGEEYAFNIVSSDQRIAAGGSIYGSGKYTAVYPVQYMDVDGNIYPFTAEALSANPQLKELMLISSNAYTFSQDGYGMYWSANLSVTKEIGKHVSLSFFANNFTNNRKAVESLATKVSAIFTPSFYYGLTCRLKF